MEIEKMVTMRQFLEAGIRQYAEEATKTKNPEDAKMLQDTRDALCRLSGLLESLDREFYTNVEVDVNNL